MWFNEQDRGSGASNLATLGVGWEEQLLHFCFPSVGAKFLFPILNVFRACINSRLKDIKVEIILLSYFTAIMLEWFRNYDFAPNEWNPLFLELF